jgi:hypothetical protein
VWWGRGKGLGAGGRNDPNNVCTYEYMNKEKKIGKNILIKNTISASFWFSLKE